MNGLGLNLHTLSHDTLDAVRMLADANEGVLNSFTQPAAMDIADLPQGLQYFNFDVVGRDVELEITPLTNRIPRRGPVGGVGMFWRELTDTNATKQLMGVSEGARGALIESSYRDRSCKFAGFGLENAATFEAGYAARGVANPKEMGRLQCLKQVRMGEERLNLYANKSRALGTPTAPSGIAAAVGAGEVSTNTARTVGCKIVALTGEGHQISTVAAGVATIINRTNADGTTTSFGGGSSLPSAESVGVVCGAGQKITWSWPDVKGALGYAVYTGISGGTLRLKFITSINQFVQLANESGATQNVTSIIADNSINQYEYDGMLAVIQDPASGALYMDNNSAALTADSTGNVQEFIQDFLYFNENFFMQPDEIVVNPIEAYEITNILLNGGMKDVYSRLVANNAAVVGGFYVAAILNPFTQQTVKITVHPFMPIGTIQYLTWNTQVPMPGVGNIWEIVMRQPYYVIDWARTSRKDVVGVYADQGLKCELPTVQGIRKNVKSVSLRKHNSG